MSASLALLLAALSPSSPARPDTPGMALARACDGHDGWSDPAPPARIYGNTYYVGTCGISVILITGPRGHILIDGGPVDAAPLVVANVARLGFRIRDVKLILSSHEHLDHAGGIAELQRLSGATVAVSTAAQPTFATGTPQADDPQYGSLAPFPAPRVGRLLSDGEIVRLGGLRLTMHATPGHAPGSTSWTWRACQGRVCMNMAYADSVSAVSADGYRFSAHPAYVATFRRSLARIRALPCDFLITPHPGAGNVFPHIARGSLPVPTSCTAYVGFAAAALDRRLAEEARR